MFQVMPLLFALSYHGPVASVGFWVPGLRLFRINCTDIRVRPQTLIIKESQMKKLTAEQMNALTGGFDLEDYATSYGIGHVDPGKAESQQANTSYDLEDYAGT